MTQTTQPSRMPTEHTVKEFFESVETVHRTVSILKSFADSPGNIETAALLATLDKFQDDCRNLANQTNLIGQALSPLPVDGSEQSVHALYALFDDFEKQSRVRNVYLAARYNILNPLSAIFGYSGMIEMWIQEGTNDSLRISQFLQHIVSAFEEIQSAVQTCRPLFDVTLPFERRMKMFEKMDAKFGMLGLR